ncbi:MAG: aminomethyltransferase family protein, partial [Solirubrobacteraceae bacterium]|nr:aminomethyltransferase family protein [Solirubrobacteraceae bacterium]
MTTHSGFGARTSALTDRFTDVHGTWIPEGFHATGTLDEYRACRERVAVMDLSSLQKWEVLGPGALPLLQQVCTRDVRKLAVGQVSYTALCHETGGMIDDATVMRLGEDRFRLVGGDPADGAWLREHAASIGSKVIVKDATDELHNLAVQGPRSREVLSALIFTPGGQPPIADLRWFRLTLGRVGGPKGIPVIVTRTGYTGELGYELFCHPSDAPAVWDAVLEAGDEHGITPLGFEALDLLRIEAGLVLAAHEFDDTVDPFEAGIGFAVALDQPEDFVGKAALAERAAHPRHRLVGLLLDGDEVVGHGAHVYVGRQRVGVVTSGCHSPYLRRPIALCRLATEHATPGWRLEVGLLDGHRKRIGCEVTTIPFYDPTKARPRA